MEKAVALSGSVGIDGWSMRDIATDLDVVPSVIYHYFANKEELCDAVVDEVCADLRLPDEGLGWKQWHADMARNIRPVLLRYPGLTDRLARGKFTRNLLPIIDCSYRKFREAGFGEHSAVAFTIFTNSVVHAIGARNMRSDRYKGERHDLQGMLARMEPMLERSEGLRAIVSSYLKPLADPGREDDLSQFYFETVVATILDGLEHVLLAPQRKRP